MKRRIYRAMLTLALGSVVLFALLSLLAAYFTFFNEAACHNEHTDSHKRQAVQVTKTCGDDSGKRIVKR